MTAKDQPTPIGRRTFLGLSSTALALAAIGMPSPAYATGRWSNPMIGSHDGYGQKYDDPRDNGARLHKGYDIGTYGESGRRVHAGGDGVVFIVHGTSTNVRGLYVIIEHPDGNRTLYQHLASISNLNVGQTVWAGDEIGVCGRSGSEYAPDPYAIHLHLELHTAGSGTSESSWITTDPKPFFASKGIQLGVTPPVSPTTPPAPVPEEDDMKPWLVHDTSGSMVALIFGDGSWAQIETNAAMQDLTEVFGRPREIDAVTFARFCPADRKRA